MSLIITVDDPNIPDSSSDEHFYGLAGFESYRTKLWGTEAIKKRSLLLYQIKENIYIEEDQFLDFEQQCKLVNDEAEQISNEIIGSDDFTKSIKTYMKTFLDAHKYAKERNCELIIIS